VQPTLVRATTSPLTIETQKALVRLGYDPGPIDGVAGANTRAAIEAYQTANGLLVTGQVSDPLLKHMLQNGG
jgi:peptidoglycan hydrolase-like protein with peptidoglycan-binding domain